MDRYEYVQTTFEPTGSCLCNLVRMAGYWRTPQLLMNSLYEVHKMTKKAHHIKHIM